MEKTAEIYNGTSLLLILSNYIREFQAFTPPELVIRQYADWAAGHDGRALWVDGRQVKQLKFDQSRRILIRTKKSPLTLVGYLNGTGTDYSSADWPYNDPYQPAPIRRDNPGRWWAKMDGVKLAYTDVDDYDAMLPDGSIVPLARKFEEKSHRHHYLIRPRAN